MANTNNGFLFRKTLIEPLGSSLFEFPYHFAARAWPLILEERTDPYETISITITNGNATPAGSNKKAHIARINDLFEETIKHVGTANIRSDSMVCVKVQKSIPTAKNQQPMQLLMQPRTFEFNTHVGIVETSKILLSHDPLMLDCVVIVDRRIQKGPMPIRELRNAYRSALLEFVESERTRLGATDSVKSTDIRSASVTVHLVAKGSTAFANQQIPPTQQSSVFWPPQQEVDSQQQQLQQEIAVPVPVPSSSGSSNFGQIYPITSPTSPMYSPQQQQQQGGGTPVVIQQNYYQAQQQQQQQTAMEARRKDQPPAPLLQPGISQTSMYFEMGQYGPATQQNSNASLPPDFFSTA